MDSEYCYGKEMKRAIERHESGEARVIPIILRPVYWQGTLGKLQAVPMDAKPVVDRFWHSMDEAFFNVAEGIKRVVENLIKSYEVKVEPDSFPQTSAKHQQLTVTHLVSAYKTDVGKQHEQNEDTPFMSISDDGDRGLFIIADGFSDNRSGEVASKLAVQKISEALKSLLVPLSEQPTIRLTPLSEEEIIRLYSVEMTAQAAKQRKTRKLPEKPVTINVEEILKSAIRHANKAILNYGEEQFSARGLGCTVTTALILNNQAFIANIGDSRRYHTESCVPVSSINLDR
jgi:Protein phosphatase 2C